MKVALVESHPLLGFSMIRYGNILSNAYKMKNVHLVRIRPNHYLSKQISHKELRKLLIYFESYILLAPKLIWAAIICDYVHFADHGQSLCSFLISKKKLIVTCHDLFGLAASRNMYSDVKVRLSGRLLHLILCRNLQRARVLTVSNFSRSQIEILTGITEISVIPNPLDRIFLDSGNLKSVATKPYALIVMSSTWRKQRGLSIKVWNELRQIAPEQFDNLYVVGNPLLKNEIEALPSDAVDKIKVFEKISDEALLKLYQEASILIHMAQFEGFGWPIIESNSQGKIAVFSVDNRVFTEVYDLKNVAIDISNVDYVKLSEILVDRSRSDENLAWRTRQKFGIQTFSNMLIATFK